MQSPDLIHIFFIIINVSIYLVFPLRVLYCNTVIVILIKVLLSFCSIIITVVEVVKSSQ